MALAESAAFGSAEQAAAARAARVRAKRRALRMVVVFIFSLRCVCFVDGLGNCRRRAIAGMICKCLKSLRYIPEVTRILSLRYFLCGIVDMVI